MSFFPTRLQVYSSLFILFQHKKIKVFMSCGFKDWKFFIFQMILNMLVLLGNSIMTNENLEACI